MLVAAKCTQCGANIQVDSTHEAGICPHCGTAFITEKAVNNYNNTYVTNNTYNAVTNINGGEVHIHGDSESADQLFQKIKDTIEGADDFSIDVFDGVTGALRKNIETFEKKFPLDARNKEIDVLIHLRQLMSDKNLSQQKLADELGVNQTTVSQWLLGRKKPGYDSILLLYEKFNIVPNLLFGIEN